MSNIAPPQEQRKRRPTRHLGVRPAPRSNAEIAREVLRRARRREAA